jgi:hypothetical protein
MAKSIVKIPVVSSGKNGVEVHGTKNLTNNDEIKKAVSALQLAPKGFRFPTEKLSEFFMGRWSPPRKEAAAETPQPQSEPQSPLIQNVQFA